LQARSAFESFNNQNFIFVTRLNNYTRFDIVEEFKIVQNETERLYIERDLKIILFDKRNKKTTSFLRFLSLEDYLIG
ncbi:hypothetical protein V3468_14705, partial [Flavobacterium oreochromis]|uniref:hypothetical protein n=1 Tax=Flavobacterium oreochromis TaxID=2906078 RepID=UPI00385EFA08